MELARMPTAHFARLNAHRTGFYECVLRCFQCFDLTLAQLFKQGKGRQWFCFWRENSMKGDNASKIWRKRPILWETNRQIETILKFLGENVTTGLPVHNNFNGQIIKLSPFMSHFDLGFWPPLATLQIWKKNHEGRARQHSLGFGHRSCRLWTSFVCPQSKECALAQPFHYSELPLDPNITYIKGCRGPFSWSFPSIRPVNHPWMASYNNPLQCEGWKTPVVLQFAKS